MVYCASGLESMGGDRNKASLLLGLLRIMTGHLVKWLADHHSFDGVKEVLWELSQPQRPLNVGLYCSPNGFHSNMGAHGDPCIGGVQRQYKLILMTEL